MRLNRFSTMFVIAICLLVLFSAHTPLLGQFTTASLGGVVTDTNGSVVPGATVTVRSIATGLSRTTTTSGAGSYLFPALPVGSYQLTVEKSGFSTYVQTGIVLEVTQSVTQSVILHPGTVQQRVSVSAAAEILPVQTSTVSQVIASQSITQLPLNGREAQQLVFLIPGAVDLSSHYCGYNCQGGVYPGAQFAQVNGGGPGNVSYELDGGDHNDNYLNVNFPFPNPDAVQEFSVQAANMSAEYGNSAAVVNIVTKSGTNQFHGGLYEFLRNGDLNGRNYFAPVQDTLKRNQFGGTAGGPILRNKLFFFFSYQGTRTTSAPSEEIAFVPTADERTGNFSGSGIVVTDPSTGLPFPGDRIPPGSLSPVAQYFLHHIPLPNGPDGQLTYVGPTAVQTENQFMPKIDYISGKNHLSGVYFYTRFTQPPDFAAGKTNVIATDGNSNSAFIQTVAINDAYVVTPSLLLNGWFSYDRSDGQSASGAPFTLTDAGVKIVQPPNTPPAMNQMEVNGFFNVGSNHPGEFDRNDWKTRVIATWQKGRHELSFGGDLFHLGTPEANTYNAGGQITFPSAVSGSNLSDFILGVGANFVQGGGIYYNYGHVEGDLYAQDNWHVNNALTLNLGIRWDPYFAYTDIKNRIPCYRPGLHSQRYPNAPTGLIYAGDPGCPVGGTPNTLGAVAPRVGFAYQLHPQTVLRGGFGLYYTLPNTDQINNFTTTAPFSPLVILTGVSFENPYAGVVDPFPQGFASNFVPPSNVKFNYPVGVGGSFPVSYRIPTIAMWNLMLDQQIGANWLFSLGYFGNNGYNLSSNAVGREEANPAIYNPGDSTEANTQARRINTNFSSVQLYPTDYRSRFETLQVNLMRRFVRGLSILTNYAWSKKQDNYGPNGTVTDPFNRNLDWGPSKDNVTNVFRFSAVWDIPRLPIRNSLASDLINGWEATGITSLQSGFPFTVSSGVDNSFSGIGADRADFTGTNINQAVLHGQSKTQMLHEYFNTSLFVPNAVGTFGNSPKSGLYGPGLVNQDFAAIKNFKLVKNTTMQFRAEFFNLFNHANFSNPTTTLSSGSFGQITVGRQILGFFSLH